MNKILCIFIWLIAVVFLGAATCSRKAWDIKERNPPKLNRDRPNSEEVEKEQKSDELLHLLDR